MSSKVVIRALGLGKSYRIYENPADRLVELMLPSRRRGTDFWALQGIDLTVHAGEAVGIIGRNGSGKSTLLQLICGLSQPSTGDVVTHGRVAGLLELGAGFNPDFTGRENVHLTGTILGLRADEIAARFDAIAEFAGIGAFMDRPVYEYSSGMYARLAFALCAHVDADILVIDEILAVGDAAFQQKCMRYLRAFRAGGGTLLFVSHNEASVLALCERAVWLDRGILQADGPSGEVCRRYAADLQAASPSQAGDRMLQTTAPAMRANPAYQLRATPIEIFDFDPDTATETGEATIESVSFFAAAGARVTTAEVGETIELRIDCVANKDLNEIIVAFIVRNQLGRPIFSDDTSMIQRNTERRIKADESFAAKFLFNLPFLLAGEYSIEAFVFEETARSCRLLARIVDSHFLSVQSRHIGGGVANIPVIETKIETNVTARVDIDVL